jgi:hypothetical protein
VVLELLGRADDPQLIKALLTQLRSLKYKVLALCKVDAQSYAGLQRENSGIEVEWKLLLASTAPPWMRR